MKALIMPHFGIGDQINTIPIVRYLYEKYSEIHLVCIDSTYENVYSFYKNCPKVKIIRLNIDSTWFPKNMFIRPKIKEALKNNKYDFYIMGSHYKHFYNKENNQFQKLPFNFYKDINIPYSVFWNYFDIHITKKAINLHNYVKNIDYVFIHPDFSRGKLFTLYFIEKHLGKSKNEMLIIDSSYNHYKPEDPFFQTADLFLNHLVHDYTEIIKNAHSLYLSDSCFFCLALHLDITTNNCFLFPREKTINYEYFWSDDYYFPKISNLKKFTQLSIS